MSKFEGHSTCPKCGSEDNLGVYDDHEHCFGVDCGYHKNYTDNYKGDSTIKAASKTKEVKTPLPQRAQPAIADRSIGQDSVAHYQVTVNSNPESHIAHAYPYFNEDGEHIANKIRRKGEKAFYWEGDSSRAALFGQSLFPAGGKYLTVVEGELDALSGFQLTGCRFPCVSVKNATQARQDIVDNFEYVNSFEEVILCLDSDIPGQKAAKEIAQLFTPGKIKILKLSKGKDPNDYLVNGWVKEYINEWWRSEPFMPDGLQLGSDKDFLEEIVAYREPKSVPYPWKGLNDKTYGIRPSELVLITADTGTGKTSILKEIEHKLLMDPELIEEEVGVGFLHLEEPKRDLAIGLMSIENDKPYHIPDVARTEQEIRDVYGKVMDTSRVVIWDHFGSNDVEVVLAKIRHMSALGCRYIFLDHLTIVVSDQKGDERKQLDEISTKIKTLTMNLDIAVFCVIHINRNGQVRGSAGPEQVANVVIRLERDKKELDDWRRNISTISVEKNRKFGRTGPACYLFYNEITGRLEELGKDQVEAFLAGGSEAETGNEFAAYSK